MPVWAFKLRLDRRRQYLFNCQPTSPNRFVIMTNITDWTARCNRQRFSLRSLPVTMGAAAAAACHTSVLAPTTSSIVHNQKLDIDHPSCSLCTPGTSKGFCWGRKRGASHTVFCYSCCSGPCRLAPLTRCSAASIRHCRTSSSRLACGRGRWRLHTAWAKDDMHTVTTYAAAPPACNTQQ
jgi:hypothetical protein